MYVCMWCSIYRLPTVLVGFDCAYTLATAELGTHRHLRVYVWASNIFKKNVNTLLAMQCVYVCGCMYVCTSCNLGTRWSLIRMSLDCTTRSFSCSIFCSLHKMYVCTVCMYVCMYVCDVCYAYLPLSNALSELSEVTEYVRKVWTVCRTERKFLR